MKKSTVVLSELRWSDVREDVMGVNPELARIIDKLNPDNSHTLFKGEYIYGDELLLQGEFHFPTRNNILVIYSLKID